MSYWEDLREYKNHYKQEVLGHGMHDLDYTVTTILKSNAYYWRYYADLNTVDGTVKQGRILLQVSKKGVAPQIGERWGIRTQIKSVAPTRYVGGFDYAQYLRTQQVYGQVMVFENQAELLGNATGLRYDGIRWRLQLMAHFDSFFLSESASALGKALLFGDRSGLEDEVLEHFRNTGVMHVLAISGLHIGILYLFLNFIFSAIPKGGRVFFIVVFLWVFAFLAGFSASVTRAVLMFSLLAVAGLLRRKIDAIQVVSCSMLLLLCIHPKWVFDVGFQLSYAAVYSILVFYPLLKRWTYSERAVWRYIKGLIGVSLSAQLGVLPLLLFYFESIPLGFIVANLVAIPLITALLFLGFSILLIGFISTELVSFLAWIFDWGTLLLFQAVGWLEAHMKVMFTFASFHITLLVTSLWLLYTFVRWLKCRTSVSLLFFLAAICMGQVHVLLVRYLQIKQSHAFITTVSDGFVVYGKEADIGFLYASAHKAKSTESLCDDYERKFQLKEMEVEALPKAFSLKGKSYLVVEQQAEQYLGLLTDVLLVSTPKGINYERLLKETKPKVVLAGTHVPAYLRERLRFSCMQKRIPFHDISEKGFYAF